MNNKISKCIYESKTFVVVSNINQCIKSKFIKKAKYCDEHTSNVTRRNDEKVLLLDTMKSCVITRNTF